LPPVAWAFAMIALPSAPTTYHLEVRPWPFVSPAAWSPETSYSGWLLYVTCFAPPWRVIVPNVPVTPAPPLTVSPASSVNGGQESTQPVLHALVVAVSGVNRYRVLPSSPVRNLPSLSLSPSSTSDASAPCEAPAEGGVVAAVDGGSCVAAVPGVAVAPVPALLQAANRSALAAKAAMRFRLIRLR